MIVDDLIATGGSVMATKQLIEQTGATVIGASTLIDLAYTHTHTHTHTHHTHTNTVSIMRASSTKSMTVLTIPRKNMYDIIIANLIFWPLYIWICMLPQLLIQRVIDNS